MVVHMDARSKEFLVLKRENADLKARVTHLEEMLETAISAGGGGSRGTAGRGSGSRGSQLPAGIRSVSNSSVTSRASGVSHGFARPVV